MAEEHRQDFEQVCLENMFPRVHWIVRTLILVHKELKRQFRYFLLENLLAS